MLITSGRAQLATEIHDGGAGTPVLMIHAGVTDKRSWEPLVRLLQPQHTCVTFDARGFGETKYEPEDFSPVDDAVAVLDATGIDRAIVVGCSRGGAAALDLTLARPDRIAGLVLIGSGASGEPSVDDYPQAVKDLEAALEAAEEAGNLAEVNRLEAWLWLDGPEAPEGRVSGAERALFLEMNGRALASPDTGRQAEAVPAWPRLEQVRCPTLVTVGALDLKDVRDTAQVLSQRIPGAEFIEFPEMAHLPYFEPSPVGRNAIAAFIERVDAS